MYIVIISLYCLIDNKIYYIGMLISKFEKKYYAACNMHHNMIGLIFQ